MASNVKCVLNLQKCLRKENKSIDFYTDVQMLLINKYLSPRLVR